MVRRLNIDGDGQGDLAGHGGEQRAVLVYQIESYQHWRRHFGRDDFGYGQFGENLTVDGLADDEVCIGDRYRIGQAEFEVTQPRVTCYRVGPAAGRARTVGAAGRPPPARFLHAGDHRGPHPGRRCDRQDQDRPARAERGGHRRAALPARTETGQAACCRPDPCPESRLAGVVPRHAVHSLHRPQARRRPGIRAAARDQGRPGGRDSVLDLPGGRRRQPAAARRGRGST